MASSDPSAQEIRQKVEEYATFLRTVLRPDHDALLLAVNDTKREIAEYEELKERLETLQQSKDGNFSSVLDTERVDLGYEKVFCRAKLDNAEHIYVHVGKGFHVELTIPEALDYLNKRIRFLSREVLPYRESKVQKVLSHIQSSEIILDQLSTELTRNL